MLSESYHSLYNFRSELDDVQILMDSPTEASLF